MNPARIKETCIYVRDLESIRDFYEKKLGLPVINYVPEKHIFFRAGDSVLLVFNPEDSRLKLSPPAHWGEGRQHFAFEVSAAEYHTTKADLVKKGIVIIEETLWPAGGKSFYFNDPADNVLEVVEDKGVWN